MSNHIGGTNKKADTPCTDERVVYIDGKPWVNAPFARSLERELNAVDERIKRLEEALDRIIEIRNSADGVEQYVTLDSIESVATKAKEANP